MIHYECHQDFIDIIQSKYKSPAEGSPLIMRSMTF